MTGAYPGSSGQRQNPTLSRMPFHPRVCSLARSLAHSLTQIGIMSTCQCEHLWDVGGNRSSQGKPTQTWRECAKSTQTVGNPFSFLINVITKQLWMKRCYLRTCCVPILQLRKLGFSEVKECQEVPWIFNPDLFHSKTQMLSIKPCLSCLNVGGALYQDWQKDVGRRCERRLGVLVIPANDIFTLNSLGNIAFEYDKLPVSYF